MELHRCIYSPEGPFIYGSGGVELALFVQDGAEIGQGNRGIGMVRPDASLKERQSLLLECSSAIEVTLSLQYHADVSEAPCGNWVAESKKDS